jgi:hypothetical protein
MPKLRVNAIAKGKYWRAGEDIPPEELPPNLLRYMATEQQRQDADDVESKPRKNKVASYVQRDGKFVLASKVELIAGEPLFWHRKRQFGMDEKWITFGRVGTEV